ncbi:hypothetical protein BHE74_00009829 [Ensete ventricosum]|nr:hypothetical protein BHE74_00009829 [Ensete ventricosum]RZR93775.1 hypothetical protein BHM03_00022346 [Ensete ventricosum]
MVRSQDVGLLLLCLSPVDSKCDGTPGDRAVDRDGRGREVDAHQSPAILGDASTMEHLQTGGRSCYSTQQYLMTFRLSKNFNIGAHSIRREMGLSRESITLLRSLEMADSFYGRGKVMVLVAGSRARNSSEELLVARCKSSKLCLVQRQWILFVGRPDTSILSCRQSPTV